MNFVLPNPKTWPRACWHTHQSKR